MQSVAPAGSRILIDSKLLNFILGICNKGDGCTRVGVSYLQLTLYRNSSRIVIRNFLQVSQLVICERIQFFL
jgi:hypothetical protein